MMKIKRLNSCVLVGLMFMVLAIPPSGAQPAPTGEKVAETTARRGPGVAAVVVRGRVDVSGEGKMMPDLFGRNLLPSQGGQAPSMRREQSLADLRHMVWLYTLAVETVLKPTHLIAGEYNHVIVRLQNGQDTDLPVTVRLRPPAQGWSVSPQHQLTVKAGGLAEADFTLFVPANAANGRYDAEIEVEAERVLKIRRPLRVNTPVYCPLAAPVPTIDGDLSDWELVQPTLWRVGSNTSAELRAQWDDEGLYLAVVVRTAVITPGFESSFWTGDCLEIFLDPDASGGGGFDANDRKYWFLAQGTEKKAVAGVESGPGQSWEVPEYALRCTPEGYTVEMHIPAAQLPGWPPRGRTRLGCDFKINDPGTPDSDATFFSGAEVFGAKAYYVPWLWGWLETQSEPATDIVVSADTSRPDISTFSLGEQVKLSFNVAGMKPGQKDLDLKLRFFDEMDQLVKEQSLKVKADGDGKWTKEIDAPCEKMGFWRVFVRLSNGVTLREMGVSRRRSYMTYAVVPDPAERKLYGEKETFFGTHGNFSTQANVMPYLGTRWVIEPSSHALRTYGYAWGQMEPDHPGQFAQDRAAARAQGRPFPVNYFARYPTYVVNGQRKLWKVYTIPTLFMDPPKWAINPETKHGTMAALKPKAEEYWRNYCIETAKAYTEQYPDREENIYQITWEPQGFKNDERLIRVYQIAYKALHETDPKAMVIGPTSSGSMGSVAWDERLLSKGLGKYLDGYSIHPYLDWPNLRRTPEQNSLIEALRSLKAAVRKYMGKDVPMFATEQGFPTGEDRPYTKELLQARCHVRSSLILMGEGYRVQMPFITYDFDREPGYGLYCNLRGGSYLPEKVEPKPVVPAYAALTFLLEGHKSSGPIEGLGEQTWGYTYRGPADTIKALWSEKAKKVTVAVAAKQVEVFDWMGNAKLLSTRSGKLELDIGPNPVYVKITPRPRAE